MESIVFKSSELAGIHGLTHDQVVIVLPFIDKDLAVKTADVLKRRALSEGVLVLVEDDLRIVFYTSCKYDFFSF